jgi:hypothetical protein
MNKEDAARRNRELMPNVAAMVGEWREHFPGLKVIYAKDLETGHSVGKRREPPTNTWTIPEGFRASRSPQQVNEQIKALKKK